MACVYRSTLHTHLWDGTTLWSLPDGVCNGYFSLSFHSHISHIAHPSQCARPSPLPRPCGADGGHAGRCSVWRHNTHVSHSISHSILHFISHIIPHSISYFILHLSHRIFSFTFSVTRLYICLFNFLIISFSHEFTTLSFLSFSRLLNILKYSFIHFYSFVFYLIEQAFFLKYTFDFPLSITVFTTIAKLQRNTFIAFMNESNILCKLLEEYSFIIIALFWFIFLSGLYLSW